MQLILLFSSRLTSNAVARCIVASNTGRSQRPSTHNTAHSACTAAPTAHGSTETQQAHTAGVQTAHSLCCTPAQMPALATAAPSHSSIRSHSLSISAYSTRTVACIGSTTAHSCAVAAFSDSSESNSLSITAHSLDVAASSDSSKSNSLSITAHSCGAAASSDSSKSNSLSITAHSCGAVACSGLSQLPSVPQHTVSKELSRHREQQQC